MTFVICKLPKAGLGNQLFPLMKASVFAHLNELPLLVANYRQIRIGTYLRGEKSKRQYHSCFNFQKNILEDLNTHLRIIFSKALVIHEPPLEKFSVLASNSNYRFEIVPNWVNYFEHLKDHRQLVKTLLHNHLRKEILQELERLPSPIIGVHIRMGDFRKLAQDEDFSKVGAVRTPEEYFVNTIQSIRSIHGTKLPVSIFTDGFRHEFKNLLNLGNITFVEGNRDIVDMLLLSKSKIIVTSAGSTFSYWSGFLSEAPIIMHPDHIHQPLRAAHDTFAGYEGVFDDQNDKLTNSIKAIQ
jgi:Glycosyl transferase family 11